MYWESEIECSCVNSGKQVSRSFTIFIPWKTSPATPSKLPIILTVFNTDNDCYRMHLMKLVPIRCFSFGPLQVLNNCSQRDPFVLSRLDQVVKLQRKNVRAWLRLGRVVDSIGFFPETVFPRKARFLLASMDGMAFLQRSVLLAVFSLSSRLYIGRFAALQSLFSGNLPHYK